MSIEEIFIKSDFEEALNAFIAGRRREPERLNELLNIRLKACHPQERAVTFAFPVAEWELNPNDALHGGITASMMDYAMGLLANFVCRQLGGIFAPTVNLNVHYLLSIKGADQVDIHVRLISSGSSLLTLEGEARMQEGGPIAASASATYKVLRP